MTGGSDSVLAVAGSVAVLGGALLVVGGEAGLISTAVGVPLAGVIAATVLLVAVVGWEAAATSPAVQPLANQAVEEIEPVTVLGSSFTQAVEAGEAGRVRDELSAAATAVLAVRTGADEAACRQALADGSWTTDPVAAATVAANEGPRRHRLYALVFPQRALQRQVDRTLTAIQAIDETTLASSDGDHTAKRDRDNGQDGTPDNVSAGESEGADRQSGQQRQQHRADATIAVTGQDDD